MYRADISDIDIADISAGNGLIAGHVVDEVECVIGDAGEILVTGETVLKGYLDGIGDSENKIRRDGKIWRRTGDAGYFDRQGRLWLLGRVSQAITDENGVLYPFCVECVLDSRFGIRGAVVSRDGTRAVVIERGAADPNAVLDALQQFNIQKVVTVKKLPMDRRHGGKIDYSRLKSQ